MSSPFRSSDNNSFLPDDYVRRKAEARANLLTLTLFAVVLAAVVGAFLFTNQRWQQVRARANEVNDLYVAEATKIEQLKALESQRAQMMEKAEITAALCERVPRWALLAELTLRMPLSMRLDSFALKSKRLDPPAPVAATAAKDAKGVKAADAKEKGIVKSLTDKVTKSGGEPQRAKVYAPKFEYSLVLAGTAEENNDIADYLAQLKDCNVIDKVELQFIRESKEGDRLFRKFEVAMVVKTDADTKALSTSLTNLVAKRTADMAGKAAEDAKMNRGSRAADATVKEGE